MYLVRVYRDKPETPVALVNTNQPPNQQEWYLTEPNARRLIKKLQEAVSILNAKDHLDFEVGENYITTGA